MISHITPALLKRAAELAVDAATKTPDEPGTHEGNLELYSWARIIIIVEIILVIPLFILTNYTFEQVLPVLAIVEDEHPPAYEPVSLDDESASGTVPGVPAPAGAAPKPASAAVPTRPLDLDGAEPITSSFMATWRLLRSHGGFRSIFRGFSCYIFQSFIYIWFSLFFSGFLFILAPLLASILLTQFNTAWVHIVMTPPSSKSFWRRLPPFKSTVVATWRPITLLWALSMASGGLLWLLFWVLGVQDVGSEWEIPRNAEGLKYLFAYIATLVIRIFVIVPAYVTLVRVQASLLPDDQETIIPFDRSFQGRVEPAVIGGTGYVSLRDAWATFSKAAWRRLIILYAQIMLIGMAVTFILGAIIAPQFILFTHRPKHGNQ